MPKLTPVDIDPFNVGMSEALPAPQAKLRAKELFGGFGKAFMSGLQDSGRAGATSMMEALENQYVPEGAVGINDAGQWTDKQGNPLNVQRRPNIVPLTKTAEGGYEGAMPAMADVWNTMGGVGGAATLGAGPVLRPALKYKDKIYKAKEGQQHLDALPVELQDTFQKMAMSGEDISHFNFGFINHKGHFLQREDALKYAIDNGLLDPNDAKYGTLVTTMLNDSGGGQKVASQAAAGAREWNVKGFEDADWFHGTTHEFDKFKLSKGNPENYLGKYPHFTTSPEDAGKNYAGHGPDLTARIERRTEELIDKWRDDWGQDEVVGNHDKYLTKAKKQATKELAGPHEGAIIPAKMKLDNPVSLVDNKPTWIDFTPKYGKDGEWVKENPKVYKLLDTLKKQGEKYGFDGQKVFDNISDKVYLYEETKASNLYKALKESDYLLDAQDKNGALASTHVISEVFKALGFDGIVMDAHAAFPNMKNIPEGTLHAVPLKRNTVKGKYSDNILFNQSGGEGKLASQTSTLTPIDYQPEFEEETK